MKTRHEHCSVAKERSGCDGERYLLAGQLGWKQMSEATLTDHIADDMQLNDEYIIIV